MRVMCELQAVPSPRNIEVLLRAKSHYLSCSCLISPQYRIYFHPEIQSTFIRDKLFQNILFLLCYVFLISKQQDIILVSSIYEIENYLYLHQGLSTPLASTKEVIFAGRESKRYQTNTFSRKYELDWTERSRRGFPFYRHSVKKQVERVIREERPDIVHAHNIVSAKMISEFCLFAFCDGT